MPIKKVFLIALFGLLAARGAYSDGFTKIGNGDDGGDLEGTKPLTSGPIADSRAKAIDLLVKLNTPGVRGLGMLLPEVQTSLFYLAESDRPANLPTDQGAFHGDMAGRVYARTIAMPHSVTRFFPASLALSESQLVALQIHEALHRSLPQTVREDESVVTQITLAITAPEANHDQIAAVVGKLLPEMDLRTVPPSSGGFYGTTMTSQAAPVGHFKQPSNIGYAVRQFFRTESVSAFNVDRMHVLHSDLYPFGGVNTPFGMGLEGSFLETAKGPEVGPLSVSARVRIWSRRDFDIGVWGVASLNTLSNEELKHSRFGRDVFTLGTSLRKTLNRFYVENYLSFNFPGESRQTLGQIDYLFQYGGILNVKVRGGLRFGHFNLGAFAEMHLADYFRIVGGASREDIGRYRILSAGPEFTLSTEDFSVSVFGRFILGATNQTNFDYLGNLMGTGVGQGSLGVSGSVFF